MRTDTTIKSMCVAMADSCGEHPFQRGDARGNEFRWQDYEPAANAAIVLIADRLRSFKKYHVWRDAYGDYDPMEHDDGDWIKSDDVMELIEHTETDSTRDRLEELRHERESSNEGCDSTSSASTRTCIKQNCGSPRQNHSFFCMDHAPKCDVREVKKFTLFGLFKKNN